MNTSKRNEIFLLSAVFLFWFSNYTYPSFLTTYVTNTLGAAKTLAGMIVGSYGLTQMILRIPLGIVSDMLKKRKMFVMIGFGLSIVSACGLTLVALIAGRENVPHGLAYAVLIFRGMSGMMAATWVNFSVLYASSYQGDQVVKAMSRIIVPQFGSQVVALAAGVIGLIVMAQVQEQPPEGEPMTLRGFLEVARNRQVLSGTALATIYQLVVWATVQGFVQNWARDVIGVTTGQLGYLSVAYLLPCTILSHFSGTVLASKLGRKPVLVLGFCAMAGACLLYPQTRSLAGLIAVQILMGSGVGLIMPLTMADAIETVPNEKRGAAMGIYQAIYGLGMFLGPVIGGFVIERTSGVVQGYIANFYVATGIAVFGGLLALLLTGRKKLFKKI